MPSSEIIFEVVDSPEGGYEAHALGYSIFTQGDDLDDLREMVRDAVACHLDEGVALPLIWLRLECGDVLAA